MRPVTAAQSDSSKPRVSTRNCGAADAGEDVVLAERHRQGPRHRLQRRVAGLVTQPLVQLLHVADVDEEDLDAAPWRSANWSSWVPAAMRPRRFWNRSARRPGTAATGGRSAPRSRARWPCGPSCRAGCNRSAPSRSRPRKSREVISISMKRPSPRRRRATPTAEPVRSRSATAIVQRGSSWSTRPSRPRPQISSALMSSMAQAAGLAAVIRPSGCRRAHPRSCARTGLGRRRGRPSRCPAPPSRSSHLPDCPRGEHRCRARIPKPPPHCGSSPRCDFRLY